MCECIRVSVLATEYDLRVYFFQEPVCKCVRARVLASVFIVMGWLRLVGSLKLWVSLAKEPYKRDDILQKRPIILRSLLSIALAIHCPRASVLAKEYGLEFACLSY